MECPRCGSPLERYTLGDRSAVTCGTCGYADVSVEHRGERETAETWGEALSRVPDAAQIASVTVETAEGDPSLELAFESSSDEERPGPTVVRVENPDPELTAALEAAEGDGDGERFVCEVCGRAFDRREQLYGHLAVHSGEEGENG
jgi:uncharacterized Zn finger protein (UPF0148 family)